MILWIDAQLSPHLAPWIAEHFDVDAFSVKWVGLRVVDLFRFIDWVMEYRHRVETLS